MDTFRTSEVKEGSLDKSIYRHSPDARHTRWLTAQEAAQPLRVKARTPALWTRQGKARAYAICGTKRRTWRFSSDDLDTLLPQKKPVVSSAQPYVLAHERSL